MQRAVELAARGLGFVEPNPPVGAVIVDDQLNRLGEGFHERFGGPHAEIGAIQQAAERAAGATLYVSLEPCCHHGKTGPCTQAIIQHNIRKVVIGMIDPATHAAGKGVAELRAAGIDVEIGLLESDVARLTAPFVKLTTTGMPYVHAKWAMTLDGRIASRTGASRWISNSQSREIVHVLRGRMDAILVGAETIRADDPLLTARPPGPRVPTRIVFDSRATLSVTSQLVCTVDHVPVMVVASVSAPRDNIHRLTDAGVEVVQFPPEADRDDQTKSGLDQPDAKSLLHELGRRLMTNVLIEGGSVLLGSFFDLKLVDELHVFIAPKIVGGAQAVSPVRGIGLAGIPEQAQIDEPVVELLDGDVYIHGPLAHPSPAMVNKNAGTGSP